MSHHPFQKVENIRIKNEQIYNQRNGRHQAKYIRKPDWCRKMEHINT